MPKTFSDTGSARPLLDIASYARRGPGQRDRLTPEEVLLIERTVRRTPEVMVKVLSRGGQDLKTVGRHFAYLSRKGDIEIETDDGRTVQGKGSEAVLLNDWDLDIQEQRPTSSLSPGIGRKAPKLAHKVLFSMPPGTPPKKVLAAVRVFAREEFGATHRYAMVLHTDEPHPHVHMVVKAVSEDGVRLNIRKATLRNWRREFARRLREQGIAANATERAARGVNRIHKKDGVFRAAQRGESTQTGARAKLVGDELVNGRVHFEPGKLKMMQTRREVESGWLAVTNLLVHKGQWELAARVREFLSQMEPPKTEKEQLAIELRSSLYRERSTDRRPPPLR